ncbi:MAG: hypothetical protein HY243_01065 [Proteobacteria bacterium]|nr:hypothetical protein [Pseudomonadota bacterium]
MRPRKAYYSVHSLCDGTIYVAVPTRKPAKSSFDPKPVIDEEGVFRWYVDKVDAPLPDGDRYAVVRNVCIATSLNVRRIVRLQVEHRLERLEQAVAAIGVQLNRIEAKLDSQMR